MFKRNTGVALCDPIPATPETKACAEHGPVLGAAGNMSAAPGPPCGAIGWGFGLLVGDTGEHGAWRRGQNPGGGVLRFAKCSIFKRKLREFIGHTATNCPYVNSRGGGRRSKSRRRKKRSKRHQHGGKRSKRRRSRHRKKRSKSQRGGRRRKSRRRKKRRQSRRR